MKKYFYIAAGLIVIGGIGLFALIHKENGNGVHIGAVLPLTGFGAYWGDNSQKGMQLAANDLRPQGISVDIVFEDSAGNPATAASAAQKLTSIDNVDAVYSEFTAPTGAVSPIVEKAGKVLYYESFSPLTVEQNPHAFKTSLNVAQECARIAQYAKQNSITKVAYVGVQLDFVSVCTDELTKILGKQKVDAELAANTTETDFRSQLLKASKFGAQMLVAFNYDTNNVGILKQYQEMGLGMPIFCDLADCYDDTVKNAVPPGAFDHAIFVDFGINPKFEQEFTDTYHDSNHSDIVIAAEAYDAVMYLARGITACGTSDSTCVTQSILSDKSYSTQLMSTGFGNDRILSPTSKYYRLNGGVLETYSI